jgi:hypothetical protein
MYYRPYIYYIFIIFLLLFFLPFNLYFLKICIYLYINYNLSSEEELRAFIANLLTINEEPREELASTKANFLKLLKTLKTKISLKGERRHTTNNNILFSTFYVLDQDASEVGLEDRETL